VCDQEKTKAELIQELALLRRQVTQIEMIGDAVNQSLYGINLYANAATEHLASGNVTQATDHLQDLQEMTQSLLDTARLLAHHCCSASLAENNDVEITRHL
jgi:signal transduction histidine kinase